jgi:hypothetical protein
MSRDIRTAFDRLLVPGPHTYLAVETLFWIVLAGAICGLAIQLVIVGGMIATMAGASIPHHARRYHHEWRRRTAVWFGGHHGTHVRPAMG